MPAATLMAWGFRVNCWAYSSPMDASDAALLTTKPAAVEMTRARDLAHQAFADGEQGKGLGRLRRSCRAWATPMMKPPMILMTMIRMPAMASPRTNLLAPSMAP